MRVRPARGSKWRPNPWQLALVLEAQALAERDVPDYIDVDASKLTAKLSRIPVLTDVPYAVQMEPHLVVEYYSR